MATAIGIDLGTSNSCVAIARRGRVEVLANQYDEAISASVVHFGEDGASLVGNQAKARAIHDPEFTVTAAKRLMGRYFFSEEVKKAKAVCSYKIVEGPNHAVRVKVRDQSFAVPEISALVLREMKEIAEAKLGHPVSQAVITVPAYFNDNQRQATRDAGRIAGLEVLRLLNEPTAAALAYGFGKGLAQRVAVYDLGGGTFDISVLEIGSDVFEVLSTCGDTYLGGEDFDDRVIDLLAEQFQAQHKINLRKDRFALEKLKAAAETAKKALSVDDETQIEIPDVVKNAEGVGLSLERTLTRTEFAGLVSDLIQRTFKVCDEALQQANLTVRDLDGVILVGGPTRLPLVREAVTQYFQCDPKRDVDPDQVVAMGAAIHAAALVGEEQQTRLLDVTPLSLRIGVAGGLAETVIERNTPVPIEQTSVFTTFKDFQQSVRIRVYQGESRMAEENELLGEFEFSGFKNARRGEVRIEVTFEIDTDGIVKVTARDPDTAQVASTQIHLSSGLSEEEICDLIDKHHVAPGPGASEPAMEAATPAAVEAAAPNPPAVDDAVDPFDALAVGGNEIEFDADELEAAAEVPLDGPADNDLDLDLETNSLEAGEASAEIVDYENEIELDGADDDVTAASADPLDSLDEADLDSLALLSDDEAQPAVQEVPDRRGHAAPRGSRRGSLRRPGQRSLDLRRSTRTTRSSDGRGVAEATTEIRALAQILDELDYYSVLEIETDVSVSEIRAAYHRATRRFHPDGHREIGEDLRPVLGRIAKRIAEAYSVLRDPRRRQVYDQQIRGRLRARAHAARARRSGGRAAEPRRAPRQDAQRPPLLHDGPVRPRPRRQGGCGAQSADRHHLRAGQRGLQETARGASRPALKNRPPGNAVRSPSRPATFRPCRSPAHRSACRALVVLALAVPFACGEHETAAKPETVQTAPAKPTPPTAAPAAQPAPAAAQPAAPPRREPPAALLRGGDARRQAVRCARSARQARARLLLQSRCSRGRTRRGRRRAHRQGSATPTISPSWASRSGTGGARARAFASEHELEVPDRRRRLGRDRRRLQLRAPVALVGVDGDGYVVFYHGGVATWRRARRRRRGRDAVARVAAPARRSRRFARSRHSARARSRPLSR